MSTHFQGTSYPRGGHRTSRPSSSSSRAENCRSPTAPSLHDSSSTTSGRWSRRLLARSHSQEEDRLCCCSPFLLDCGVCIRVHNTRVLDSTNCKDRPCSRDPLMLLASTDWRTRH